MHELTTVAVVWTETADKMPTAHAGPYWIVFRLKDATRKVAIAMRGYSSWYDYGDNDIDYQDRIVTHWAEMDWAALPSD